MENPIIYNLTMTDADTEYSYTFPNNTKQIEFRCRGNVDIIWGYTEGSVDTASPPGPYRTLKAGQTKGIERLKLVGFILYFACASSGQVVEIEHSV